MSGSLGSLTVALGLDAAEFTSGLSKSEYEARRALGNIERQAREATDAIKTSLKGAFTLIGIDLSVRALADFTKATFGAVDALNDAADATGASIENISALEDVARLTGTSLDTVSTTLVKFNQVIKEADPTKGAGAALKAIGLSVVELKALDPAEAVRRVAVALNGFADDGTKARIVQELFGKSVKEAAPFLKDLAEQTKLVGSTSAAQAAEVEKFNKEIFKLQTAVTDLGRDFVKALVPALNSTIDLWRKNRAEGKSYYETITRGQLALLGNLFGLGIEKEGGASGDFSEDKPSLTSLLGRRPANEGGGGFNEQVLKDREDAAKKAAAAMATQVRLVDSYLESLRSQIQSTKDLTAVEKALDDIGAGRLGNVSKAQREAVQASAQEFDLIKQRNTLFKEQQRVLDEATEAQRVYFEDGIRVFEQTRTPLEQHNAALARLNTLRLKGAIDGDTHARAIARAQDAYTKLGEEGKKQLTELGEFTRQAARNIQDQLGTSLYDAAKGDFDRIDKSFGDLLLRMSTQAVAADLGKKLFGDFDKTGNVSGWVGDVLGFLGAGTKSTGATDDKTRSDRGQSAGSSSGGWESILGTVLGFFGGGRAIGGEAQSGRLYRVNERRPEMLSVNGQDFLMVGSRGGRIDPNPRAAGGHALNVSQTFVLNQPASRDTQVQVAAAAQNGLAVGARNL